MGKVKSTTPMLHGHTRIEFEDGSTLVMPRTGGIGWPANTIPAVGDEYPPAEMEIVDASSEGAQGSEAGDGEVQSGEPPLGQQEGAGSDQPEAGDSNIPVGSGAQQEGQAQQEQDRSSAAS